MITGSINIHAFTQPKMQARALKESNSQWLELTWTNDRGGYLSIRFFVSPQDLPHIQAMAEAISKEAACLNQQPQAPQSPSESTQISSS